MKLQDFIPGISENCRVNIELGTGSILYDVELEAIDFSRGILWFCQGVNNSWTSSTSDYIPLDQISKVSPTAPRKKVS